MGRRKLNLTSLFSKLKDPTTPTSSSTKSSPSPSSSSSWPWPSCNTQPKTSSFRCDHIYKTTNSIYFNSTHSSFTNSSHYEETSSSTISNEDDSEAIIRGLMCNDRLFFEPGGDSSSIVAQDQNGFSPPFKESLVLAMESEDPYSDFRKSMEEMVVAYGIKEWECFEDLLSLYLRVNGKKNHGFIVGAFVDLLVGFGLGKEIENCEKLGGDCFCCDDDSMSSISFEIEEAEEGSGSC